MTSSRQALGQRGENLAADYFNQQGYVVVERNFRTPYGEIDLIVRKHGFLVFVAVKTRATGA